MQQRINRTTGQATSNIIQIEFQARVEKKRTRLSGCISMHSQKCVFFLFREIKSSLAAAAAAAAAAWVVAHVVWYFTGAVASKMWS